MSKSFGRRAPSPPDNKRGDDDKRPSVFERLGVRRDIQSSSSQNTTDNFISTRKDSMKPVHHGSVGRDSRPRGIDGSKHLSPPTPSYSPVGKSYPPYDRKYEEPQMHQGIGKFSKTKDISNSSVVIRQKKGMKDSPVKNKSGKGESLKRIAKKNKDKKAGGGMGKKRSEKKKKKVRSSSASSGETSDSDSSSTSTTTSTSSSTNSSSSDSSVPSVKLKTDKAKVKKKSKALKAKAIGKKPSPMKGSSSSRSSSSGGDPNSLRRSNIDLREKLNARSPQGIKDHHTYGGSKDMRMTSKMEEFNKKMKPYDYERERDRGPMPLVDKLTPKKRCLLPTPPDPYTEDQKRRRVLSPSPSDKYRQTHLDNVPPLHHQRRVPPPQPMHDGLKRGRSPPQQGAFHRDPRTHSPGRRLPPRMEDVRRPDRPDFRMEGEKRNSPFNPPGMKSREFDRHREPDFGRDGQRVPKERVAPLRNPIDMRAVDNREKRTPMEFQRNRPSPFQQTDSHPGHSRPMMMDSVRGGRGGYRNPYVDRDRQRYDNMGGASTTMDEKPRIPLLPKSKEALAERYNSEQMKKSGYIDKWVNETVKTVQVQRKVEDIESPRIDKQKSTEEEIIIKTEESEKNIGAVAIVEAEDLSDFSDDADEILNNDESFDEPIGTPSGLEVEDSLTKDSEPIRPPPLSLFVSQSSTQIVASETEKAPSIASHERTPAKIYPRQDVSRSVPSQSQTDDDILERMDFEEISEDELGEVENNKVHIVDALGIDWTSLVCQEKIPSATSGDANVNSSVRKKWNPANMLAKSEISKSLVGEKLYSRIMTKSGNEEMDPSDKDRDDESKKHLNILNRIGLGPNSRALSSRRDYALRRHLLGLPQKNILSMDSVHQSQSSGTSQEMDSVGELYKLSLAVFRPALEASALSS